MLGFAGKMVMILIINVWFKRDNRLRCFGMQLHQLDHMQTICTYLQTDNHTNTSSTSSFNFYRLDALPDDQPTASKHWRHHAWQWNGIMDHNFSGILRSINILKDSTLTAMHEQFQDGNYTVFHKKWDIILMVISLLYLNWFWKFFHWLIF